MRNHLLAYLRPALDWAAEREIITGNPAAGGSRTPDPRRREARTRDRYLDDDVKSSCSGRRARRSAGRSGRCSSLLLLTGQRRDELAHAPWSEFDLGKALWVLPRERSKNDKEHVIHLPARAVEIIEALPTKGQGRFLFTTNGSRPVSGFGRGRERLVAAMLKQLKKELVDAGAGDDATSAEIAHFTLHDLRRSAATGMAGLGIAHHVVDRVLNHTAGTIRGVARVYNRYQYLDERKAALETWARHVDGLVSPRPSNVVQLAGAR